MIIASTIQLYPEKRYYQRPDDHHGADHAQPVNSVNPAIKSLNYLNNILAESRRTTPEWREAIMLNNEGFVAECAGDKHLHHPEGPPLHAALEARARPYGITCNTVLQCAAGSGISTGEPT